MDIKGELLPALKRDEVIVLIQNIVGEYLTPGSKLFGKSLGDLEKHFSNRVNAGQFDRDVHILRNWFKVNDYAANIVTSNLSVKVTFLQRQLVAGYQTIITKTFFGKRVGSYQVLERAQHLLGTIPIDVYFVSTLLFASCLKRSKNDSLLVPILSGKSSLGKTKVADPICENAKSVAFSQSACGRWKTPNNETCYYLSDIQLKHLFQDLKSWKNISRGERTDCKVFAESELVQPKFLLCTSNECFLPGHIFEGRAIAPVNIPVSGRNKNPAKEEVELHQTHLEAVRMRMIEFRQCRQAEGIRNLVDLPYENKHAVLGLFGALLHRLRSIKHSLAAPSPFFFEYLFACFYKYSEEYAMHQTPKASSFKDFYEKLISAIDTVKATIVSEVEQVDLCRELEEHAERNAQAIIDSAALVDSYSTKSPSPIKIKQSPEGYYTIFRKRKKGFAKDISDTSTPKKVRRRSASFASFSKQDSMEELDLSAVERAALSDIRHCSANEFSAHKTPNHAGGGAMQQQIEISTNESALLGPDEYDWLNGELEELREEERERLDASFVEEEILPAKIPNEGSF